MNEKQFDPLDDRFRQAAEQFEPPYDPQDWIAMEKLLDGKKKKRRILPLWWITDGLMAGMLLLFIFQLNKNEHNPAQNEEVNNFSVKKGPEPAIIPKVTQSIDYPANIKENGNTKKQVFTVEKATSNNQNKPAQGKDSNPNSGSLAVNTSNLPAPKPGNDGAMVVGSVPFQADSGKIPPPFAEQTTGNRAELPSATAAIGSVNQKEPDSTLFKQQLTEKTTTAGASANAPYPDSAGIQGNPMPIEKADSVASLKDSPAVTQPSKKGDLFVSASIGLEKSGVKESSLGPSGIIYGGFAGYQFHKDWSIKLGILFTDKNYSGGSGIYKLPPGSYYQEITNFNAICKIIEIPLLISYQFKQGKKSNWQISAGPVTSIMKKEEYHYNYINNSGGTGYGKKYYSTGEVDWFSGLRISPAYEHYFGSRFSLSAEPYIQLPLSGVGQGSVKLYSLGLQVTTSIHLNPAKRK